MSRTCINLDWNLPLLPAITQHLLNGATGSFLDLSDSILIVPTVQSGRRLREALALEAGTRGLFPPEILTPDLLLTEALKDESVASEESVTAAWVIVLGGLDFSHFEALFPVAPTPSTGWKLGMAQRFMQLRSELGEEGLDFAIAAERAAQAGHEPERWRQLARLEGLYINELKLRNLKDPKQARREAAQNYSVPAHIKRIILAATPDPQPLPLQALDRAAEQIPVEVWTYGIQELFDDWGRPLTEIWQKRPLLFEAWGCNMQTLADPKATAELIAKTMQSKEPESVLLGLADPTLNPTVADALMTEGIPSYDPEGQTLQIGGVGRLTELLCQLCADDSTPTIRTLLQHPDIDQWLESDIRQNERLRLLDKLFERHLAPDLAALLKFSEGNSHYVSLHNALKALNAVARELQGPRGFAQALAKTLQSIYSKQEIKTGHTEGIPWKERADAIRKLLHASSETESKFIQLPTDFSREAFRQNLKRTKVYPDRPREAHDLLGWLELLWNDAPHLILAGLNEGIVPESIIGDTFLPETLREVLGLRTNAQRFARDAYLLEALCRRRANEKGRIDLLIPRTAADNTPLRPSRLLFLGSSEKLLSRTRKLFREIETNRNHIAHNRPWRLSPPPGIELPTSISVSALKSYLECPFRFFLRNILKMRTLDVETRELTPATFGTLFHDTVAELKGQTLDDSQQEAALIKELHQIAENKLRHRYGEKLSFALRLQHEALMARIVAFCQLQIEDIQLNGRIKILNTEDPFEMKIDGFTIKGTIDRIDQRGEDLELIDYKTADSPKTPREAHLARVAKKAPPAHLPEAAFFEHEGKSYRWTDLQLPLYVLSKIEPGKTRPSVAYFNLAKTVDKSRIARWDDFTESHLDSARACASAVIEKIKAGVFWPPNQDIREEYDDFAALFPDGIENSVNPEAFMNYRFTDNAGQAKSL
jgi:ATP-dependent helicase/nuclease subunit B